MNDKLTLQELIDLLAVRHQMEPQDADAFVREFWSLIEEGLKSENYVKIKGLGTFKLIDTEARESINIQTGERIEIQSHARVTFTPEASLRDLINRPFAHFETVVLNDATTVEDLVEVDEKVEAELNVEAEQRDEEELKAEKEPEVEVLEDEVRTERVIDFIEEQQIEEEQPFEEEPTGENAVDSRGVSSALAEVIEEEQPMEIEPEINSTTFTTSVSGGSETQERGRVVEESLVQDNPVIEDEPLSVDSFISEGIKESEVADLTDVSVNDEISADEVSLKEPLLEASVSEGSSPKEEALKEEPLEEFSSKEVLLEDKFSKVESKDGSKDDSKESSSKELSEEESLEKESTIELSGESSEGVSSEGESTKELSKEDSTEKERSEKLSEEPSTNEERSTIEQPSSEQPSLENKSPDLMAIATAVQQKQIEHDSFCRNSKRRLSWCILACSILVGIVIGAFSTVFLVGTKYDQLISTKTIVSMVSSLMDGESKECAKDVDLSSDLAVLQSDQQLGLYSGQRNELQNDGTVEQQTEQQTEQQAGLQAEQHTEHQTEQETGLQAEHQTEGVLNAEVEVKSVSVAKPADKKSAAQAPAASKEPAATKQTAKKPQYLSEDIEYKIVGTITTHTLRSGETLTRVALKFYGNKKIWPYLVMHNKGVIKNPDNVPIGTTIRVPKLVPVTSGI